MRLAAVVLTIAESFLQLVVCGSCVGVEVCRVEVCRVEVCRGTVR